MSTASAPLAVAQRVALGRVVDEHRAAEQRPLPRAAHTETRPFPQRRAVLVDDARRVEHVADREPAERAGDTERDEPPLGNAVRNRQAHARRRQAEPLRDPLLRGRRAAERQPVSVHARLRTVSFKLLDASYAADGSKPQWIAQCSQRGSLPGPYASHSMPSSSASYVGKMPSVSR